MHQAKPSQAKPMHNAHAIHRWCVDAMRRSFIEFLIVCTNSQNVNCKMNCLLKFTWIRSSLSMHSLSWIAIYRNWSAYHVRVPTYRGGENNVCARAPPHFKLNYFFFIFVRCRKWYGARIHVHETLCVCVCVNCEWNNHYTMAALFETTEIRNSLFIYLCFFHFDADFVTISPPAYYSHAIWFIYIRLSPKRKKTTKKKEEEEEKKRGNECVRVLGTVYALRA